MSSAEKPSRSPCTSLLTINFVRVQTDPGRMRSLPARELILRGRSSRKQQAARNSRIFSALRSEEHTSELQSRLHLVCRLLLQKQNDGTTELLPDVQTDHRH